MPTTSPRSGLRFHVLVEMADGTKLDIHTKITDILRWEKNNGGQAWMVDDLPLDRQLWIVWAAARRLGLTDSKDADGWIAQIAEFQFVNDRDEDADDGIELDPTPPAPSDA